MFETSSLFTQSKRLTQLYKNVVRKTVLQKSSGAQKEPLRSERRKESIKDLIISSPTGNIFLMGLPKQRDAPSDRRLMEEEDEKSEFKKFWS